MQSTRKFWVPYQGGNKMLIVPRRRVSTRFLEQFPGAAAAYSLQQLGNNVTSIIRARKSSDNTSRDFTAEEITNGTLVSWVGAGNNGFLTRWYDQLGFGDAIQNTLGNEPLIVSSGSLITTNGKPSARFVANSSRMTASIPGISSAGNLTVFSVVQPSVATSPDATSMVLLGIDNGGENTSLRGFQVGRATSALTGETYCCHFTSNIVTNGRIGSSTYANSANEQMILRNEFLATGYKASKNGVSINMNLNTGMTTTTDVSPLAAQIASNNFHFGSTNGTFTGPAFSLQEMILFFTEESARAASIEQNMKTRYEIP